MIAAALVTTIALAFGAAAHADPSPVAHTAGYGCHPPGTQGIKNDLPPKVHTFIVMTELRALRFLDYRLSRGDVIYCEKQDAVYWTDLNVTNARNARIKWHVMVQDGDLTKDWTSWCRLYDKMKKPTEWHPKGFGVRCTPFDDEWSG
jgi:hypothetical protein